MKSLVFPGILGILGAATVATVQAGPVQNGAFEQAIGSEWTPKDPNGLVPPTLTVARVPGTRSGGAGQWVLECAGRDHVQDGPLQGSFVSPTLKNTLSAAGNGRAYTTRVWVKLDVAAEEASFRCLLRWRDNGVQQIPLILAEAVVLQPGVWTEATATATLAWTTSLSAATIDFEVEQLHRGNATPPPPQWFPAFQIDDLEMESDGDGDGLWDSEESSDHAQAAVSFSDDPDSDGDRMTDDWERAHGLDARDATDAGLDGDSDEFTNVQEFFGATDPFDAAQYPGKPSDPLATHETRALLRYLALRPWRQQALVGQMVSDNATGYTSFVEGLAAQPGWGRWPAILGLAIEKGDAPLDIAASVDHAIAFANAGGIVQFKWAMWNPWTGNFMGDAGKIDVPGLLDPAGTPTTNNTAAENQAARATMLGWIDTVAAELQRFNAATGTKPLFFRPLSEMNGGHFWWGLRSRAEYLGIWNLIRDRLMTHHGLHNLIWVYESASGTHQHPVPAGSAGASDYYYPGDDRVDVMSHNFYDDDWVLGWDANKIYARYPKIYGMPQSGPGKSAPTSRDGSFDNMNYINRIADRYPRASFFIVWDSFTNHDDDDNNPATPSGNDDADPSTPDTPTYKHLSIIDNTNPDLLMTDARVVTRDELRWRPPANAAADALSASALAATWTDLSLPGQDESAFRLEIGASAGGPWSVAQDVAAGATSATAIGQAAASTRWLRVRSLFDNGDDSLPTDPVSATTWSQFGQWKHDMFGDADAPSDADDDSDGLSSALEFFLASDPHAQSHAAQPDAGMIHVGGFDYLTLTFRRRVGAGGVDFEVQSGGDLAAWPPDPVLAGAPIDNGDGSETVTYRDIVPLGASPARFMRLRVSAP